MGVAVMFNNKRLDDRGLVCMVDTSENGYSVIDMLESVKTADATGSIEVNGERLSQAYFQADMNKNSATLTAQDLPWIVLDLDRVHIDISIYGDLDLCRKE